MKRRTGCQEERDLREEERWCKEGDIEAVELLFVEYHRNLG